MIKMILICDKCGDVIKADQPKNPSKETDFAGYSNVYPNASIDLEVEERDKLAMLLCPTCTDKWRLFSARCKAEWTKQILSFFEKD